MYFVGFTGDGIDSGDGCEDIDECSLPTLFHTCGPEAKCVNAEPFWTCDCKPGFVGDGVSCKGTTPSPKTKIITSSTVKRRDTSFGKHLLALGKMTCNTFLLHVPISDIDECQAGASDCHANATCRNLYGSYCCDCQQGRIEGK